MRDQAAVYSFLTGKPIHVADACAVVFRSGLSDPHTLRIHTSVSLLPARERLQNLLSLKGVDSVRILESEVVVRLIPKERYATSYSFEEIEEQLVRILTFALEEVAVSRYHALGSLFQLATAA